MDKELADSIKSLTAAVERLHATAEAMSRTLTGMASVQGTMAADLKLIRDDVEQLKAFEQRRLLPGGGG